MEKLNLVLKNYTHIYTLLSPFCSQNPIQRFSVAEAISHGVSGGQFTVSWEERQALVNSTPHTPRGSWKKQSFNDGRSTFTAAIRWLMPSEYRIGGTAGYVWPKRVNCRINYGFSDEKIVISRTNESAISQM